MSKSPLQAADAHAGEHHIVPTSTYILTLLALTILMLITVGVYYVDVPGFGPISGTVANQTIALAIAVTKASLVVSIFMGVWWGTKLTKLWAVTGFIWFFLLGLILIDYPMRAFESVDGWEGKDGAAGQGRDGSALPRVVPPSGRAQAVDANSTNLRPRQ